jgi:hypothetical protein
MQINLPPQQIQQLTQQATVAGYDSLETYVSDVLLRLAGGSHLAEPSTPTEQELAASLEMCDRGMNEINSGGGIDAREALLEIGRKRGFSPGFRQS